MNKKFVLLIISLLIVGMVGCNPQPVQEEPETNIEVLEQEYIAIINLADNILFRITEDDEITVTDAFELVDYIQKNRIKPTQPLTIELNECLDELLELGINYSLETDAEKITELEEAISLLLDRMETIAIEIEELIETSEENNIILYDM